MSSEATFPYDGQAEPERSEHRTDAPAGDAPAGDGASAPEGAAGHEEGAEGEGESEGERLWSAFRERAINLRSMPARLRLATGLALAWMVVAVVLLGLRGLPVHLPNISLYAVEGQLVQTAAPVLVAVLVLLVLAWTYLLTGLLHAHPALRAAALAVFTWILVADGSVSLPPADGWQWAQAGLAFVLWLIGGATVLLDRRRATTGRADRTHQRELAVITWLAVALVMSALYALGFLQARSYGAPLLFTNRLTLQLFSLTSFLVPALLIAGTDFADWSELTAARIARALAARQAALVPIGAAVVALAVLAFEAWSFHQDLAVLAREAGLGLAAVALAGGFALLLRREVSGWSKHVPYLAIVLAAIVGYAVPYLYLYLPGAAHATAAAQSPNAGKLEADMAPYAFSGKPAFSFLKPVFWEVQTTSDQSTGQLLTGVVLNGIHSGDPAIVSLEAVPASVAPDPHTLLQVALTQLGPAAFKHETLYLRSEKPLGGWERYEFATLPRAEAGNLSWQGLAYSRQAAGETWSLVAFAPSADFAFNQPAFDRMAETFQLGAAPAEAAKPAPTPAAGAAAVPDYERGEVLALGVLLLLTVAGLVAVALRPAWRRPALGSALLLFGLIVIFYAFALPNYTLDVLRGRAGSSVTPFHLEGVQTLAALATIAWLAWNAARGRLRRLAGPAGLLLVLNLALVGVALVIGLYGKAQEAGRLGWAQAVIVLLALLWDVTMSGESITNGGGAWLPRHGRVLLFFGYIMLVAACVLYFSSLTSQASGAVVEPQFESEGYPQAGLVELGIPLVIAVFGIRLAAWWNRRSEES